MAQVYPGQEVTVNPGAFGNGYLLYPGGKYGRHVGRLLQPGEKLGAVHLHMPSKHKVVVAKRVKKTTEPTPAAAAENQFASSDDQAPETPAPKPRATKHTKAAPAPAPASQFADAETPLTVTSPGSPPPKPRPAQHAAPPPAAAPETQFASAPDMNLAPAPAPTPRKAAPPPSKPVKVAKAAPPPPPPSDMGAGTADINNMPEDSAARLIASDPGAAAPVALPPPAKKQAPAPAKPQRMASATPPPALAAGMRRQSTIPFAAGESSPAVSDVSAVHGLAATLNAALAAGAAKVQLDAYGGPRGDKSSDAHRLSLKRALVIRELLIEDGVPAEKIDVRALGGVDDGGPADRVDVYTHA